MLDDSMLVKKIKPNFKALGPRYGKLMKQIAARVNQWDADQIKQLETEGKLSIDIDSQNVEILLSDVEIFTEDIPGWLVSSMGQLTVALDITITEELKQEGIARELINRIQNIRKDKQYEVTDKIAVTLEKNNVLETAVNKNYSYICSEILAESLVFQERIEQNDKEIIELIDNLKTSIAVTKQL
jgi:isoleucyl-tRNA synthetase